MANSMNLDADADINSNIENDITFDGSGIIGQTGECNSSFINNGIRGRLQQLENQTKVFWLKSETGL
jgi:hypothetical protein